MKTYILSDGDRVVVGEDDLSIYLEKQLDNTNPFVFVPPEIASKFTTEEEIKTFCDFLLESIRDLIVGGY